MNPVLFVCEYIDLVSTCKSNENPSYFHTFSFFKKVQFEKQILRDKLTLNFI